MKKNGIELKDAKIEADDTGFVIQTGASLSDKDKIEVCYEVVFKTESTEPEKNCKHSESKRRYFTGNCGAAGGICENRSRTHCHTNTVCNTETNRNTKADRDTKAYRSTETDGAAKSHTNTICTGNLPENDSCTDESTVGILQWWK